MSSQKVVIPKWMINPEEVTVIEIPAELKSIDTVIIKPKLLANADAKAESAEPNLLQPPRNKSEKLDANIYDIPQWNEYFAQAIKRRTAERHKELYSYEVYDDEGEEDEQEDVDYYVDENLESEVELTESEILMNYEYIQSAYNPNNDPLHEMDHSYNLREDNDFLSQPRHKLMKSPYSNVNKTVSNIIATQGKKVEHVADLLDLVEQFEYTKIHRDLKDFQKARRKLVFSTTKLSTTPCFTIAPE